jgi:hypothetical protein
MGLFGSFVYKSKKRKKNFWLHMTMRGKTKLYFFSEDPKSALSGIPGGFEVFEDQESGLPFLRKKKGGFLGGLIKTKTGGKKKEDKK